MQPPSSDGSADPFASFDPLAFFVGRVEHAIDTNAKPIALGLDKYINREKKIVTSTTGEITWDYGNGLLTINAPTSQAAAGFLAKAGPIKLTDVTIESNNEYGTIHLISLDGQPLATSKKILVQAFTEEKMEGFRANNGTIADIGHPPHPRPQHRRQNHPPQRHQPQSPRPRRARLPPRIPNAPNQQRHRHPPAPQGHALHPPHAPVMGNSISRKDAKSAKAECT